MSRSTQYIGLTIYALKWLVQETKLVSVLNGTHKTFGMFDEDIPLKEWKGTISNGYDHEWLVREEVQCVPWSSGPMIFTHLVWYKRGEMDQGSGPFFSWVLNPGVEGEFDYEQGHFYV